MAKENEGKRRQASFAQEIIDMIVDNFDNDNDEVTLNTLCKVSASWESAVLTKLYSVIDEDNLDEIDQKPYLAKYVTGLNFLDDLCDYCDKLKSIEFTNLKEVLLNHDHLCDNIQQFLCRNTCFHDLNLSTVMNIAALDILEAIAKARMLVPNYQPLLSYTGPLDKKIASCLQQLGAQSIHVSSIRSEGIVPCFSQFKDLQDISLEVDEYEQEDNLIEGLKYLSKFKSLYSFDITTVYSDSFSQNVFTTLGKNVLQPNATTLQKFKICDISGLLKFPSDQHWPNLKELNIQTSKVCPMNLIKFCEKAPNIQDISIEDIDATLVLQHKVDVPIKVINSLKKLSSMLIHIDVDHHNQFNFTWYEAGGAEIRYIRSQNVDERLCIEEDGKPESKLSVLKEQYKSKLKN